MSKMAKREGPDPVNPVTINGVRFEAIHWGEDLCVEQNGGYISAVDPATNERLWILKVYNIDYDPARERDVQDLFITGLENVDGNLKVVDEDEREFIVDLQTRTVAAL